jgi:hypothetical protein
MVQLFPLRAQNQGPYMLELTIAALGGAALKNAWEKLADSLLPKVSDKAKEKWKEFVGWPAAQLSYNERVINHNSKTILLGNPHPVIIDEVYIDLVATTYAEDSYYSRDSNDGLTESSSQLSNRRVDALNLLNIHHRIYVTGKPGAGKTTYLKYLALQAAKGKINRIPVLLVLRNWSENQSLEKQICAEFDVCNFPEPSDFVACILRDGRAILLLDGLDEIKTDKGIRRNAINEIDRFAKKYPAVPIVLSCRTAAEHYSFEHFSYAELADFTDAQQRGFVKKWFAFDDKRLRSFMVEWEKPESRGHRELAATPLLLALLCLAFNTHYKFAPNRTQLYEDATSALFSTWDASRSIQRDCLYEELTHQRKRQILSLLAFRLWTTGHIEFGVREAGPIIAAYLSRLPPKEWKQRPVDADEFLRDVQSQHGLIFESARGEYRYSHLTLHEYFAACHVGNDSTGKVLQELFNAFVENPGRWEEVFVHTVTLLSDAEEFFKLWTIAITKLLRRANTFKDLLGLVCSQVNGHKHIVDWSLRTALPAANPNAASEDVRNARESLRKLHVVSSDYVRHRELGTGNYEDEGVRRARMWHVLIGECEAQMASSLVGEWRVVEAYADAMRTYSRCLDLAALPNRQAIARGAFNPIPISGIDV